MDAVQLTGAPAAPITPASSAVTASPAVNASELLMVTAALLLEKPRQILNHTRLVETVLRAAGPQVSTVALRPVWEVLPLDPEGDEHREYAARLILTAKALRAVTA